MKFLNKLESIGLPKESIFDSDYEIKKESFDEFSDLLDREGDVVGLLAKIKERMRPRMREPDKVFKSKVLKRNKPDK